MGRAGSSGSSALQGRGRASWEGEESLAWSSFNADEEPPGGVWGSSTSRGIIGMPMVMAFVWGSRDTTECHNSRVLTVYIRINVCLDLQADKSSVVVSDPSSLKCEPKVSNPWNNV
jgi:hypothetical protein